MSLAFVPPQQKPKGQPPNQTTIQKMLDENNQLIQTIIDYQNSGKAQECMQYQQILHRNLVYLATIADANQNVHALLPAPGQGSQAPGSMPQPTPQMTQMRAPGNMPNPMTQAGSMQGGNQMSQAGPGMPPVSSQAGFSSPMGNPQQSGGPSGFPRPQMGPQQSAQQQAKGNMMPQGQGMTNQNGSMGNQTYTLPPQQQQQPPGGYPNQQQPMMSQQQPMMSQPQPMMSQPQPMMTQPQPMMSQQQPMMSQQQPMISQGQQPLMSQSSSSQMMMNNQSGIQSNSIMGGPRGQMPPASYRRSPQVSNTNSSPPVRRDSRGHFLSPEDEHDECPTCLTCTQSNTCDICRGWSPERWEDMRGRQEQSRRRRERKAADKASRSNTTKEPSSGATTAKSSSNPTTTTTTTNGESAVPVAVTKSSSERVERVATWTQPIAPCPPPIQSQPVFTVGPAVQPTAGPGGLPPTTVQWSAALLPAPGTTILPSTARLLPGPQHAPPGTICQLPGSGTTPAAL
ncbi:protein SSXT-like isoform X2 [Haliotis rubra]|uniref:protein SSXT-like isoform X2 n=1 Tax=Haliotis rubra TaxID=36100 RepID=UPI001EE62B50|nr:protein SSXT-like isoform X2 [Haliotis rubra]